MASLVQAADTSLPMEAPNGPIYQPNSQKRLRSILISKVLYLRARRCCAAHASSTETEASDPGATRRY